MARDDELRKKRRREEREVEHEETAIQARKKRKSNLTSLIPAPQADLKIEDMLDRVMPLIEQLNSLYQQYAMGVEQRPPVGARARLDQLITALTLASKPTAGLRFRFSTLFASYQAHKDRWERLLKDIESGKIHRVTGPKRAGSPFRHS